MPVDVCSSQLMGLTCTAEGSSEISEKAAMELFLLHSLFQSQTNEV